MLCRKEKFVPRGRGFSSGDLIVLFGLAPEQHPISIDPPDEEEDPEPQIAP
jgi:hypothetical protein